MSPLKYGSVWPRRAPDSLPSRDAAVLLSSDALPPDNVIHVDAVLDGLSMHGDRGLWAGGFSDDLALADSATASATASYEIPLEPRRRGQCRQVREGDTAAGGACAELYAAFAVCSSPSAQASGDRHPRSNPHRVRCVVRLCASSCSAAIFFNGLAKHHMQCMSSHR